MASDSKSLYFGFVVDVFSQIVQFFLLKSIYVRDNWKIFDRPTGISSKQNARQLNYASFKKSERTSGLTESSILVSRWQVIQKLAIVVFVAHFFGRVYFDTRKGGGGGLDSLQGRILHSK